MKIIPLMISLLVVLLSVAALAEVGDGSPGDITITDEGSDSGDEEGIDDALTGTDDVLPSSDDSAVDSEDSDDSIMDDDFGSISDGQNDASAEEAGSDDESSNEGSDSFDEEFSSVIEEDIYQDVDDVALEGEAGLTPDSSFYVLENLVESVLVGDDPVKALEYKEEKILELQEMVDQGDEEAAEKVLERVEKYNEIIKREVSPDMEKQVRESSKAVKGILEGLDLEGDEWEDIQEKVDENAKEEDKIALAAKVSKKISELCEALSSLDPLEYSKVCRTGDEAPQWKRDQDRELTAEQEKEAKKFFEIMSSCYQNPAECKCEDISIKPFAEQCAVIAPLAAECESGNEEACKKMDDIGDPIDLLPDYLQDVMADVEDRYGEAKHDLFMPPECVEEGALTKEACFKVMFRLNAPPECQEALEAGKIDPKNEREARAACEEIMFTANAPEECLEAGLKDHRDCERFMFKLDAPQECLDAGLTGSGRDDWKKCEAIRFKLDAPEECVEAGLTGSGRDDWRKCDAIRFRLDAPQECLDAGIDGTGKEDWKKCELIKFKLEAPQECLDAGLTGSGRDDWKKCEKIRFLLDAPEECKQFADKRDPWKACQPVQFKMDAPQECLDAGLDGTGRDDWKKCDKIRMAMEQQQRPEGDQREGDFRPDDRRGEFPGKEGERRGDFPQEDQRGQQQEDQCRDCSQKCGDRRWNCNNGQCECFDDGDDRDESPSGDDHPSDSGSFDSDDSRDDSGSSSDSGSSDSSDGGSSDSGSSGSSGDSGSSDSSDGGSSDSGSSGSSGDSGSGDSGSSGGDSGSSGDSGGSEASSESSGDSVTGSAVRIFNPTGSAVKIFDPLGEKRFRELGRFR
ncbi:MAG TPA: hypothetical protein VJI15_02230 [Candidatus Nanoarchaeia archaeon]|nr:hypothetical protein [Candidatus Nanoarchaeia archaeon]